MAVSLTAVRRLVVGRQGFAPRFRRATRRRRSGDPPAERRAARFDLRCRPRAPADAVRAHRRLSARHGRGSAPHRTHLRVLGARGVAAADRAVAALPQRDGGRRPLGVARPGAPRPCGPRRARSRAHPCRRAARLARLRGPGRRRYVELEAGEDGARGALGPRRARDRRPPELPATVRPRRAGDPESHARRGPRRRPRRCASSHCSRSLHGVP